MLKKLIPILVLVLISVVAGSIAYKFDQDIQTMRYGDPEIYCWKYEDPCPKTQIIHGLDDKQDIALYVTFTSGFLAVGWLILMIIVGLYKTHLAPGLELRRLKTLKEIEELKK